MTNSVVTTELNDLAPPRRGKVRDIYDLGSELLIVATDRISAYDCILAPGIPGKGKILNQLTNFWMQKLESIVPHHLVATEVEDFPRKLKPYRETLRDRAVVVRKTEVIPFECVARGYLAGSAFREYKKTGETCGIALPEGLQRASRLDEPLFTPATKAEEGHDENVGFDVLEAALGSDLSNELRRLTLEIFASGGAHAAEQNLLLADTKFEFGQLRDEIILIDEVLTPDSSRFWSVENWKPGVEPVSFDKQYVRNWLDEIGWDHESTPPELPPEVVRGTLSRYCEAFEMLSGTQPKL